MGTRSQDRYLALRRLGDLGRELERRPRLDPYPHPSGRAPDLQELRRRGAEIKRIAARHGARRISVFGSVARDDSGPDSDVDVLVDMSDRRSLLAQAALQDDLEELLGCRVHVVTLGGLSHGDERIRERIEREAVPL